MPRLYKKRLISALIALIVFLLLQILPSQKSIQKTYDNNTYIVKRVIDGDTIELENKQIVRYIGVDSPELHHPKKSVECFASASAEFNRKLVEGKTVRLEKDVSETDKYKRLLRYVYVDQVFINKKLVDEGYAYAATFPPDVKFADLFRQSQQEAMENKKGLWSSCKTNTTIN